MAEFVAKLRELGFTHAEPNRVVTPPMLAELLKTGVSISSIHSPCPTVLSSKGIDADRLSLSSLDVSERVEAITFAKKTIDLAANVDARAIVIHMGEVPIDLGLQDRLHRLHDADHAQTKEYRQIRDRLVQQRASLAQPYVDAAKRSLHDLSEYSGQKGIMLGVETRFHFNEIPSADEMAELLGEVPRQLAGYWHDTGHAQVQQQLGFAFHEEWLSRFGDRMVGIHLHDIRGISDHHAPGKGNMNWEMIAKYLPGRIVKVCEIGEWNDEERMKGAVRFLRDRGILG